MNIQFDVDYWVSFYKDEDGNYIFEFPDNNGNTFQAVIRANDKRYFKQLLKELEARK